MSESYRTPVCEQYEDSYELWVLGSLEEPEATSLAEHVASGCRYCHSQLQRAIRQTSSISQTVPLVSPPARLRARFAASIGAVPADRPNRLPWLMAAAAGVLLAFVGGWQFQAHRDEQQISRAASAESARVSGMLEILAAPGTVELPLADASHQQLHGALYVHKKLGMALVVDRLPTPPAGWIYESWVIPNDGVPHPIESFDIDAQGRATSVLQGPVEISRFSSMLISMEPLGSAPLKPTTPVFQGAIPKAS